jgi:Xaa-Pro dipeptidase
LAIRAGLLRAYEIMRPGVKTADVFNSVVETVRREGIPHYQRNHVGPGIGLDGYDVPNLTPYSTEILEEKMVLSVETPYYEVGFAGLQGEEMVRVTSPRRRSVRRRWTRCSTFCGRTMGSPAEMEAR